MLQQMLTVIRGMKDPQKLGQLQGAVLARICTVTGTDPVSHLENLIKEVRESLTHEEADDLAQRTLGEMDPYPGESPDEYAHRMRLAKARFSERYPNWRGGRRGDQH